MSNASIGQDDWAAGIWRGRKAPANAVYDAVNGLINDEGGLFRRGAASLYSASNAGVSLQRLVTATLAGPDGQRVIAWGTKLYTLDGTTPVQIYDAGSNVYGRPVGVGGVIVFPAEKNTLTAFPDFNQIFIYGGSLKAADVVNVGTITVTNGSPSVTKAGGASWVGTVDPGMFLAISGQPFGLVRSVDGANALTLVYPYGGATASTGTYTIYASLLAAVGDSVPTGIPAVDTIYVGTAGRRLLVGVGNRVYLAEPGFPFSFTANAYHELPAATRILGIQGTGENALVFSTTGVWRISNLSLDIVDDAGNVQQQVEQVNGDVVLWSDLGLAAWDSGLVVPAIDDVYLASPDFALRSISEGLRPLYRSYVNAGYQPGMATIHRGHYKLPILNGATLVDTLVCRLDRPTQTPSGRAIWPWTRWAGQASSPAYAVLVEEAARSPKLLGLSGQRVTNLTATLDGTGATDADGSNIGLTVTTNDMPLSDGTATKLRLRYELVSAGTPTVAVEYSSDHDAGAFTALTVKGGQYGATGGVASDGGAYSWWQVNKRRDRIRFRITFGGTITSVVVRALELLYRPSGKQ